MSMDLTGITNQNEYYTNHYFSFIFEENASETISAWRAAAKDNEEIKTPWSLLRDAAKQYYPLHDRYLRAKFDTQILANIRALADTYLKAFGYPKAQPEWIEIDDTLKVPVYLEIKKTKGAPALWILLAASQDKDAGVLEKFCFSAENIGEESSNIVSPATLTTLENEDLATKILFGAVEPPRFLVFIGMNQIALIDRNKWNEKRYLQFELEEIFSRHDESTLQAMAVLLHRNSLCPEEGTALLDELDANSLKHAAGVSQDLKYALRESIELLGNEVLYDMAHRQDRNLDADPVDAGQLTMQSLRYMYRMLFVLFIESRPELGYAPIKAQSYMSGYSLESLRDIADNIRDGVDEVGSGFYLHETLSKLYELIYNGYPESEEDILKYSSEESLHDMFVIAPLKAHIFDPEYTKMITDAKLRNSVMLRIIDLMSLTRSNGRRNSRRGRISYANLGINQMGSVYEALLSYRGFIAEHTLFEVKRAGDSFNELDVGYFVSEGELDQYTEDERVRYEQGENKGKLRRYEKGTFIYRLAGREREKSASYYTPEVLTKCLVKYALKELLEGKTADEILNLTICEPAMGSAAFLNEAINQLAEAYIDKKQKELGVIISYEDRYTELQKVKMFIADRNVYGIDLNPVAVELAEVSLWLNTIYGGGFVPWFGTQLVCGNSLIGARRQCYRLEHLTATAKGMRWYENAPERVPLGTKRMPKKQVYHFLIGDPSMASYSDKVIKSLEPDKIKQMVQWNKRFNAPYDGNDLVTLLRLSAAIDDLWEAQINLRKQIGEQTKDSLSVYGHEDVSTGDSHITIRQKDKILSELYKSEHMKNAGPYARLKFAMDYWCSLWFWPINKSDLLPSRSEFLFDMSLILEGTTDSVQVTDTATSKKAVRGQLSMFPTEMQQLEMEILNTYNKESIVDIPALRRQNPRLNLAYEIAEQNHFMHWELEFADLFAERGGFDLIIGNPPWVKLTWNEQDVLSESEPHFAIRKFSATQVMEARTRALSSRTVLDTYLSEYVSMASSQNYINAEQNYSALRGLQGNLYECFLPQAWTYANKTAVFAFIHPESVFSDAKGINIRKELLPRMRKHFRFSNALKLFQDVHTSREFGLNVFSNQFTSSFEQIVNLYEAKTVDECYDGFSTGSLLIRDENGKRNTRGHSNRVTTIGKRELKLFAKVLDDSDVWESARLLNIHAKQLVDVLNCFEAQSDRLSNHSHEMATSMMWDETNAQKDGTIVRNVHFGEPIDTIISGAHIGTTNPLFNCSNQGCNGNNDNSSIDLQNISKNYLPRVNYSPNCTISEYQKRCPQTEWGQPYINSYRVIARKMIDIEGERTLMPSLIPPKVGHTNGVIGFAFKNETLAATTLGIMSSLPVDFFVKICGRGNFTNNTADMFPVFDSENPRVKEMICRALLLNCLTDYYGEIWNDLYIDQFVGYCWSKADVRLNNKIFSLLTAEWNYNTPIRSAYARRQAMVEIDVLVAQMLSMNLQQLLEIYQIQFPILQQHEKDTYYDYFGKIVYAKNNALTNVGFSRIEFEANIKGAPAGQKFYRTITDDTMPGGPMERTIEYVAPFDRCDREQDYETAWKFFEEKYKEQV